MIQMYQKITQLKVLEHFFRHPSEEFYLRELARLLDMSPMTVKRSLDMLAANRVITREEAKGRILYRANADSLSFRHLKISYNLALLEEMGIVEKLFDNVPGISSIVLYGSHARGENDEHSDIDILVISAAGRLKSERIEGVNVIAMTDTKWGETAKANRALYLDVITEGIVLHGRRPVVE